MDKDEDLFSSHFFIKWQQSDITKTQAHSSKCFFVCVFFFSIFTKCCSFTAGYRLKCWALSTQSAFFTFSQCFTSVYTFPLLSFHKYSVCVVRMCKIIVCSCFQMCDRIESIDLNESTFNFLVKPWFSKDMTGCQIVWKIKHFKCDISRRIRNVDGLILCVCGVRLLASSKWIRLWAI